MASPIEIRIWTSFLLAMCCFSGAHAARVTLKNNCPFPISPVARAQSGSQVNAGGQLSQQASRDLDIPPPWNGGIIYARFDGDGGYPPATLAEFTIGGGGGNDYYDVSIIDGFNLPMRISPSGGCRSLSCPVDINNRGCPNELAIRGRNGGVVGCKSACFAFGAPCGPSSYTQNFKNQCPDAYTYPDDHSTAACPTGNSYLITFCP